jgi:hypothetical protein
LCKLRAQNITAITSTSIPAEQKQCLNKILRTKIAKSLIPPLPNAALPQVEPPALYGLVIGTFVIEGIDDDANRAHARLFFEQLLPMMQNSGPSWKLSTRKKYDQIMDAMVHIRTGDKMGEVWATYPQAYKWWKSYAPVNNGVGGFILVERPPDAFGLNRDDINVGVDSVVKLTYFEAAYSNIRKCHLPDHTKGRTLYTRVCVNHTPTLAVASPSCTQRPV